MSSQSSNSERSHVKELVLAWLKSKLEEKGFAVEVNAVLEGRTTKHLFDLYAEIHPLTELTLSLGVLVFESLVRIEDVERVVGLSEEFPQVKFAVIPLEGIEPDARNLAAGYGIGIIAIPEDTLSKIQRTASKELSGELFLHVDPVIDLEGILREVLEEMKSSFFKRAHGKVEKIALLYIPLIEVVVEYVRPDETGSTLEVAEIKLVLDGLKGYLVKRGEDVVDVRRDYWSIKDIPLESLKILRVLSEKRSVELEPLAGEAGVEVSQLRSMIALLANNDLVDVYGDLVEFRGISPHIAFDIEEYLREKRVSLGRGYPRKSDGSLVMKLGVSLTKIDEVLESMNTRIKDTRIIYYPFYVALVIEGKDREEREKVIAYDALTGNEAEGITTLLADPETINDIRSAGLTISSHRKPWS